LLETEEINDMSQLFISQLGTFWKTHYHFGNTSAKREKKLGLNSLNIILINTAIPVLFLYGKKMFKPELSSRAIHLMTAIKPESNSIISHFKRARIVPLHAGDSQALIQLKREYCEKKKCIYCRWGQRLLRTNDATANG